MTTNRNDIVETILKLRAKGEQVGEAEANAIFRKAEKLMSAYAVEEAELAMKEADGTFELDVVNDALEGVSKNGRNRSRARQTHYALERYCEVQVCYSGGRSDLIYITGHRPDVEMFKFLATLIYDAMERQYQLWRRDQQAVGRSAKASFQSGMALRIRSRLDAMTHDRDLKRAADVADAMKLLAPSAADKARTDMANGNLKELTSTAMVVTGIAEQKQREVYATFKQRHPRLYSARGFGYASGGSAYAAGKAAGDRVNFGRPVGDGGSTKLLA